MNKHEQVRSQTVLEYLVMINEQSYSGIGRQLQITPQQFSDWIKKRRPIPQERLQALASYFGVDGAVFADSSNFAKALTPLEKIKLHILIVEQKVAQLEEERAEEEDIAPYREKKQKLLKEKADQHRLEKMAVALQENDERVGNILDTVLAELECGHLEELEKKLNTGGARL